MKRCQVGLWTLCLTTLALLQATQAHAQAPLAKPRLDSFGDPLPDGVFYRLGTPRLRHYGLNGIAFSADGTRLYSTSRASDMRVWDVASGKLIQQVPGSYQYHSLVVSRDDRYVAGARGGSVFLLAIADGKVLAEWKCDSNWRSLAFSGDGKSLVGITGKAVVYRWDIASRKEIASVPVLGIPDEYLPPNYCRWELSPDGTVVFCQHDTNSEKRLGPFHFWDTTTGKACRPQFATHTELSAGRTYVNWSPDSRHLAVSRGTVEIWDTLAGKRMPQDDGDKFSRSAVTVALHPDGKLLAHAKQSLVELRDLASGKSMWTVVIPTGQSATLLAFSPDGKTLAVGCFSSIVLLDTPSGARSSWAANDSGFFTDSNRRMPFMLDGRVFVVQKGRDLSLRETVAGKEIHAITDAEMVAASSYGSVIGVMKDKAFSIMEIETGKELWRRDWEKTNRTALFGSDGKTIALLHHSGGLGQLVERSSGKTFKEFRLPWGRPGADGGHVFALSLDLKLTASSQTAASPISICDLSTGNVFKEWSRPKAWEMCSLAFLPGGGQLLGVGSPQLTGRADVFRENVLNPDPIEWTCIWEVATGKKLHGFKEKLRAASSDGRWLALGNGETTQIRHTDTGRVQASIPRSNIFGFSGDGSLLIAAEDNNHKLELWDTAAGRLVRTWHDPLLRFWSATFSWDNRTLMVATDHGIVLACDVTGLGTAPGQLPALKLSAAEADGLWKDLNGDDGPRSHQAFWKLVAGGDAAVKMLKQNLQAMKALDPKEAAALLADLDSDRFAVRQKAMQKLETMENALPALAEALARNPGLELHQRIEAIQAKLTNLPWDANILRQWRTVKLLEQIGTAEARQVLTAVADGPAQARLTNIAKLALARSGK